MKSAREHAAWAFGQALRTRRRILGVSQERLAEIGDLDRTYPSLLERGLRTPTFYVILQLAISLRTDPRVLFAEALAKYCESLPDSERRAFHTLTELSAPYIPTLPSNDVAGEGAVPPATVADPAVLNQGAASASSISAP